MPNRCELATVTMVQSMHALCSNQHEESLESSLHDWSGLGLYYGLRLIAWAQNFSDRTMPLKSADSSPVGVTFNDITFKGPNVQLRYQSWDTILDPAIVVEAQFRWSVQKNLNNGETTSQSRNVDTIFCPVQSAIRMRLHAQCLNANENSTIAVFTKRGVRSFITNKHIMIHLQAMATNAHGMAS